VESTGEKTRHRANNKQDGEPFVAHAGDHYAAPWLNRAYSAKFLSFCFYEISKAA